MNDFFLHLEESLFPVAAELAIQSFVLMALVSLVAFFNRKSSAATRHTVWMCGFAALCLLPLGRTFMPRLGILPSDLTPQEHVDVELSDSKRADLSQSALFGEGTMNEPGAENDGAMTATAPSELSEADAVAISEPSAPMAGMSSSATTRSPGWRSFVILFWAAGSFFFLLRYLFARHRLSDWRRSATKAPMTLRRISTRATQKAGINRHVPLLMTDAVAGPALAGILKPVFLIPPHMAHNPEPEVLESLFLHEALHLSRRDPLTQAATRILNTLYWFNPFCRLGVLALAKDREILVDKAVVNHAEKPVHYARGILDVLKGRDHGHKPVLGLGAADGPKSVIEERLDLILDGGGRAWMSPRLGTRVASVALVAAFGLLSVCLGLHSTQAAETRPIDQDQGASELVGEISASMLRKNVRLVIDLPEPAESGRQMTDWPAWRRARAGSYVFEGAPLSFSELEEQLARYGVKQKEMQEDGRPRVSKTVLHLRIHKNRSYRDLTTVLTAATRADIAIYKIDLALYGHPEKLAKIALPVDTGVLEIEEEGTGEATEVAAASSNVEISIKPAGTEAEVFLNGRLIGSTAATSKLQDAIRVAMTESSAEESVFILDAADSLRFESLMTILQSAVGDARRTIGFKAPQNIKARSPKVAAEVGHVPSTAVKSSIERGLGWLARQQKKDGSFRSSETGLVTGPTALAVLAFLGDGNTHRSGPHFKNVALALKFLVEGALPADHKHGGCLVRSETLTRAYEHAVATLALAESYNLTKDPVLKAPLEGAVAFILKSQNPYKAWRYNIADGQNDTAVTTWMMMALLNAQKAGIRVPKRSLQWGTEWYREMTDSKTGRIGYVRRGERPVRDVESRERFPAEFSESLTAMGLTVFAMRSISAADTPSLKLGLNLISNTPPAWNPSKGQVDYIYWFYGALAMKLQNAELRTTWHNALAHALTTGQDIEGKEAGSWTTKSPWGETGGRIYTTAMALLALEVVANTQ